MQYKTLLPDTDVSRLSEQFKTVTPGLWMLDLDPRCDSILIGPFDTIAEAHDKREYLWNYGDRYGRYLWLVNKAACTVLNTYADKVQYIELGIDTTPLEVISVKLKTIGINEWIRAPRKRLNTP